VRLAVWGELPDSATCGSPECEVSEWESGAASGHLGPPPGAGQFGALDAIRAQWS
jgi:hypothetical protein